jgi:uracil-DNA glycosylase
MMLIPLARKKELAKQIAIRKGLGFNQKEIMGDLRITWKTANKISKFFNIKWPKPGASPRTTDMSRIVAVGEAWGADEAAAKRPFVGKTGQIMNWLFEEAGLIPAGSARAINRDLWQKMYRRRDETYERAGIHLTNVLNIHPPGNKIPALCQKDRVDALPGIKGGQYLRREFYHHLERLKTELDCHRPNVIIGLGAVASWFLLRDPRITKIRGAVASSPYGKVLPTFHPAYLLRGAWKMRPVVTFDLIKAGREAEYPEVRRPPRFVYIPESPDDISRLIPEIDSC